MLQATDPQSACYVARDGTPVEALFLSAKGGIIENLGVYLTSFFDREIGGGLHVTTNMIRTIMETATKAAFDHGLVTQGEMAAAHNVNGHSSLTAQRHYQLVNSLHDAQTTRGMMDRLMPEVRAISPLVHAQKPKHLQLEASVPVLLEQLELHLKADSSEPALVDRRWQNVARSSSSNQSHCQQDDQMHPPARSSNQSRYHEDDQMHPPARSSNQSRYQEDDQIHPPARSSNQSHYQEDDQMHPPARSSNQSHYQEDDQMYPPARSSNQSRYQEDDQMHPPARSSHQSRYKQDDQMPRSAAIPVVDDSCHALTTSSHNLITNPTLSLLSWSSGPGWGHKRMDIGISTKSRYDWIYEEKMIIGEFCLAELKKFAGTSKYAEAQRNIVSSCLEYIRGKGKAAAYPWFHPVHIAKSDRLKSGYESTRKMEQFKDLPTK